MPIDLSKIESNELTNNMNKRRLNLVYLVGTPELVVKSFETKNDTFTTLRTRLKPNKKMPCDYQMKSICLELH